jgi:hypothetical protein
MSDDLKVNSISGITCPLFHPGPLEGWGVYPPVSRRYPRMKFHANAALSLNRRRRRIAEIVTFGAEVFPSFDLPRSI